MQNYLNKSNYLLICRINYTTLAFFLSSFPEAFYLANPIIRAIILRQKFMKSFFLCTFAAEMKKDMNKPQKLYLETFGVVVIIMALIRCVFPSIAGSLNENNADGDTLNVVESVQVGQTVADIAANDSMAMIKGTSFWTPLPRPEIMKNFNIGDKHPIVGVHSYSKTFPDSNDVHLVDARKFGVDMVHDRDDAERRKSELVYMAASPFYHVDPLKKSIPYLVPRAAVLLNDIGRNFFDSLYVKQIPLHQLIVTSVLRSEEDLEKLKQVNHNTSENSCHLYGTTFDIGYNRYRRVPAADGKVLPEVGNDTLKWVLSEVLRDLREEGRCHVKHEVKQGCFHITVR